MEEVAAALVEVGPNKVKLTDVPGIVMLCVEMHKRYEGFCGVLVPTLLGIVNGNGGGGGISSSGGGGGGGGGEGGDDGGGNGILPRRICLRLLTDFVLYGIITDTKPIMKVVAEAAGAPSSSLGGNVDDRSSSGHDSNNKEYAVTDANLIVTFAKCGGHEIMGVVPRSVRLEYERLEKEITGKGEGTLLVVPSQSICNDDDGETKSLQITDATAKESDAKSTHAETTATTTATTPPDLETPFTPTLPNKLLEKAQSTMALYTSTTPYARAVPSSTTNLAKECCLGAYRTLSNSYLTTHRRLLKLEKRCEQDRLLQGNLSDAREKGLKDAQSLMESLKKSVEALSEALDVDVPLIPSSEDDLGANAESTDGKGIELWTKSENDSTDEDARLGPFDDEETRSFYCDVPDLLATNPAAMLGIAADDVEKKKESNKRQYGGVSGAVDDAEGGGIIGSVDEAEVVPMAVDEMEGDALDDGDAGDGDVVEDGEDEEKDDKGKICGSGLCNFFISFCVCVDKMC